MKELIQLHLKGELLEDLMGIAEAKEISLEEATMYVLDLYHLRAKNLVKSAQKACNNVLKI